MTNTAQLVITNIEEDMLACLIRGAQSRLQEVAGELEARMLTRDELFERVKEIESGLKKIRQRF